MFEFHKLYVSFQGTNWDVREKALNIQIII